MISPQKNDFRKQFANRHESVGCRADRQRLLNGGLIFGEISRKQHRETSSESLEIVLREIIVVSDRAKVGENQSKELPGSRFSIESALSRNLVRRRSGRRCFRCWSIFNQANFSQLIDVTVECVVSNSPENRCELR